MLPLSLLNTSINHPILVELKSGETYNGHLHACDNFMNLVLREVVQTSAAGDTFWRLKECYVRGSTIKFLRVPEEVVELIKDESAKGHGVRGGGTGGRGGGGGGYHGGRGGRGGAGPNSRGRARGNGPRH